ncbi:MAG TPA: hypothetical protein VKB86_03850 [Pyrinomonadaceae bacterium]|nr:hypothetical protein [Pyrinomonadaceae bacterium]
MDSQSHVRAIIHAMKLLLPIFLLTPVFALGQGADSKKSAEADDSSLTVVKYSWRREREASLSREPPGQSGSSLPEVGNNASDRSVNSRSGSNESIGSRNPTVVNAPTPAARQEQVVDNSIAALHKAEDKAINEAGRRQPSYIYKYWVRFNNSAVRKIRAFYWELDTQESSDPADIAQRQFFCKAEISPGKMKDVQAVSHRSPSLGINAAASSGDSLRPYEKIVVNRVEYEDGTIWQRPTWKIKGNDPVPMFSGTTLTRVRGCIELRNAKTK